MLRDTSRKQPITATNTVFAKEVGNLVGTPRHLRKAQLDFRSSLLDAPNGNLIVAIGIRSKVVQRPVELMELWPTEIPVGCLVVRTVL